jgi:hypothetical protein
VTMKAPPSLKVQVSTCMTARNTEPKLQTYQAVQIAKGETVLLKPDDSRAVTLSSDLPEEASSACHIMEVDLGELSKGAVKPGDEISFKVLNRKADTPEDPGKGVSTVLDRNVSVLSLVTGGEGTPGGGGEEPKPEPKPEPQPGGGLTEKQVQEIVDKAVKDALDKHIENCTPWTSSPRRNPEQGWKLDVGELRAMGGVSTAFIPPGAHGPRTSVEGSGLQERRQAVAGQHRSRPADREGRRSVAAGAVAGGVLWHLYGSGTVRIEKGGDVYLLDWTYNNELRKGHLLRMSYEFMAESKCQGKEGAPAGDGKPGFG